jgi:ABC-type lipoprotein export system ATPase subunit
MSPEADHAKPTPLFEADGLGRSFVEAGQRFDVLNDLAFRIPERRLVAICGPSGAGKSTLLHILGLLDRDFSGTLRMHGQDLSKVSVRSSSRYRLQRIGFVFQRHHVIDAMSVLENVAWPHWRLHGDRRGAYERARLLLAQFGLSDRMQHHPSKLSGGELQRVALSRALVNAPSVILADEPTAQLDEPNARHIIDSLRQLRESGHSIVVVTHDPNLADAADLVLHMRYGRFVELANAGRDLREGVVHGRTA